MSEKERSEAARGKTKERRGQKETSVHPDRQPNSEPGFTVSSAARSRDSCRHHRCVAEVLKTDNTGRSTAPQKGPIRSNLRGSSIGPSARSDGRTTALALSMADRVSRSPFSLLLFLFPAAEMSHCQRERALTLFIADIGAYVAINPVESGRR